MMTQQGALGAIKRRWWVVVLFTLAGAALGALPEPDRVEDFERRFTATHTLLLNQDDPFLVESPVSPNQLTLFATTGEVPTRAAETIGYTGNPASLAAQLQATFDQTSGALTLSSTQIDPANAERVADTFAEELIGYLTERQDSAYQDRLAASLARVADAETELVDVTNELARRPEDPVLQAQQNAISRQYSVAFEQAEALGEAPSGLQLTTLQRAQAVEVTEQGLGAPRSRQSRALLGAAAGLALGLGVALVLGRLDRRIRTRDQAEDVLDMRARAVLPTVRDSDRDMLIVTADRHDPLSDSYRTVRNLVNFVQSSVEPNRARVTLVVSPSPGDGKTALAVNLAAAFAENGSRTVVMNADFRRPRMLKALGDAAEEPAPLLLEDVERLGTRSLITRSGRSHLRVLDLSRVDAAAGELVRATTSKLPELERMCDHVVVDSSPVGATAEVLDLVPFADTIVLLTRVGHTKISDAQRTIAILRDLSSAPMLLVLGGLKRERSEYYEYGAPRRPRPAGPDAVAPPPKPKRGWRFWRRSGRSQPAAPIQEELPFDQEQPVAHAPSTNGDDDGTFDQVRPRVARRARAGGAAGTATAVPDDATPALGSPSGDVVADDASPDRTPEDGDRSDDGGPSDDGDRPHAGGASDDRDADAAGDDGSTDDDAPLEPAE